MRQPVATVLLGLLLAALVGACTDEPEVADDGLAAVVTPVPSPSPAPSPTPVEASPTPEAEPSPSPSPSPTAAPLDEDEALAAARARRAERDDCDAGFADDAHMVVAEVEGAMLVYVVCFVGAYQPSGELRVWDGTALRAVPVEQWQFGEPLDTPDVTGLVESSPDGATVVNDVKYRGLGDCGLHQRWGFDGTGLVLELAREQECSDDGEFVPPDQWPVVFER